MSKNEKKGTAVITGASSGIGAVYADRLAGQGYDLVLVARRADRLEELAERLRYAYSRKASVISADLADDDDVRRVERAVSTDDSVTLLVNNAGLGGAQVVATADADAAERMIKVNVIALTRLTRAVLPGFLARNRGAIVNIASVLAFDTSFGGIYSGTKAYVVNFTEALQREVAGTHVQAQVVLPGATRTDFWEAAGSDIDQLPKEIIMTADDMVDAALVGLARGEAVTVPALADTAKLDAFLGARQTFYGSLHADKPAARYAA
ncbi:MULTISPECIES: SDR family oxidoreductase [unclassified Mesorhizobium]|uniref:SDR family NAD(P)-dependent oxidoreductase n=1 Tax=unclassified Mesorhizobium TaxID=325217 RepID=UPI001128DF33|nr:MULTISPECIES: SDR family oxidoreductase [unclassified Mesorhizobium]TPK68719.1 SDR family oxidoreductase [Mesorhizobium sp. B2-5-1]TPM58146.1 SDR family oxidoreductase [Mesorhizobium sp. B2-1-9]TPM84900.1 SDR family oxidoreductase [Mesorhizobium sp. B2-1-4]TPN07324.1 SDR family oxidoreductase [Mesorhizobium sp. B2-1-2]UCI15338.1 SDR family oxidoreductase [Mesorhizobium sp. B2-1-1]